MKMRVIPTKVDIHITNVCNLSCENCNRFSNHKFTGWQDWADYKEIYQEWSKKVELTAVTIMGGEPFLNPSLHEWVQGLNELFGISVQILTNGTRFAHVPKLYHTLPYRGIKDNHKNSIGVSMHLPNEREQLEKDIVAFLAAPVTKLSAEENPWKCEGFIDANHVRVNLYDSVMFGKSALQPVYQDGNLKLGVHNNPVNKAHENCSFARWKSYHFIRGKLYKCGTTGLLPELDQQNLLHLTDQQRELIYSYQPLTVENYDTYSDQFFKEIDLPIPQCTLCSIDPEVKRIFPIRKNS